MFCPEIWRGGACISTRGEATLVHVWTNLSGPTADRLVDAVRQALEDAEPSWSVTITAAVDPTQAEIIVRDGTAWKGACLVRTSAPLEHIRQLIQTAVITWA
jgi:hypothetical protein